MIAGCLRRMEDDAASPGPVLETYRRGLKTLRRPPNTGGTTRNWKNRWPPTPDSGFRDADGRDARERRAIGPGHGLPDDSGGSGPHVTDRQRYRRVAEPADADPTRAESPSERPGTAASPSTIRIDQSKLDRLMRVVGELLVARGAFPLLVQKLNDGADGVASGQGTEGGGFEYLPHCRRTPDQRHVDSDAAGQDRLSKIPAPGAGSCPVAWEGSPARLEGEGIELDKTILEQIGDPLVHVIRNAVDHGIETPEERRAKGKDASGQVTLRAHHGGRRCGY